MLASPLYDRKQTECDLRQQSHDGISGAEGLQVLGKGAL
jgi:hypothetical protein